MNLSNMAKKFFHLRIETVNFTESNSDQNDQFSFEI
jgi:hypothetical protein